MLAVSQSLTHARRFQVIYTLAAFGEIGLTHFDLHGGNVFVDDIGSEHHTIWIAGPGKYRLMSSRNLVKLYDFDRSYKVASRYEGFREPIVNRALLEPEWVEFYGSDQTIFDPCMDIVRLASYVAASAPSLLPRAFLAALKQVIDLKTIGEATDNGILSFSGTLCYKTSGRKACKLEPDISTHMSVTPAQILADTSSLSEDMVGAMAASEKEALEFAMRHSIDPEHIYALPSASNARQSFIKRLDDRVGTLTMSLLGKTAALATRAAGYMPSFSMPALPSFQKKKTPTTTRRRRSAAISPSRPVAARR